jgi:general secretion pathway protein I
VPDPERRESGFTLVELLVAFTIATILLAAMLRVFAGGVRSSARTQDYGTALAIAESTLDSLGATAPLNDGDVGDRQDGRYHIATAVSRYGTPAGGQYLGPYELVVTVSWPEGARRQAITLRTLRLAPLP